MTEGDRDLVASAFGVVVASWCDGDNTHVKVMEVKGVSDDRRCWVLALFGTTKISGDAIDNIKSSLKEIGCDYYIDADIKPSSGATNSYGNTYSSAICVRVPRSDYHKDVEELRQQEKQNQLRDIVRKKGAVFGRFTEKPSTLSRVSGSDDESESRSDRLMKRQRDDDQFKTRSKLTTAERFVDNLGALHRAPGASSAPKKLSETLSFGERVRNFFFFIDADKV